jgi:hypothetical protein
MADDDLAILPDGMVRIVVNPGEGVNEDGRRLFEAHPMLPKIAPRLCRIPRKLHGGRLRQYVTEACF